MHCFNRPFGLTLLCTAQRKRQTHRHAESKRDVERGSEQYRKGETYNQRCRRRNERESAREIETRREIRAQHTQQDKVRFKKSNSSILCSLEPHHAPVQDKRRGKTPRIEASRREDSRRKRERKKTKGEGRGEEENLVKFLLFEAVFPLSFVFLFPVPSHTYRVS